MKLSKEQLDDIKNQLDGLDAAVPYVGKDDAIRAIRLTSELMDHADALQNKLDTARASALDEWREIKPGNLPEYDVPVLVMSKTWPGNISAAVLRYYHEGWLWEEHSGFGSLNDPINYEMDDDYQYTHWTPMPEPLEIEDLFDLES